MKHRYILLGSTILIGCLTSATAVDAQSSATPYTSAARYDESRRLVGTILPDPDGAGPVRYSAVRNTYNATGWLIKVEEGVLYNWASELVKPSDWAGFTVSKLIESTYDTLGRKMSERISADGQLEALTQYNYDSLGRLKCTMIRMDRATFSQLYLDACIPVKTGSFGSDRVSKNIYDPAGRIVQIRKAVGTAEEQAYVTYSYTSNGLRQYVIDAKGNKSLSVYDAYDFPRFLKFPSKIIPAGFNSSTQVLAISTSGALSASDFEEYRYDNNGNRTILRRRDGRNLAFRYDAANRVISKIINDGCAPLQIGECPPATATRDVFYLYDLGGLQIRARYDSETGDGLTFTYDGFGNKTTETITMAGVTRQIISSYDQNDNRTGVNMPGQSNFQYDFDGLDRLKSLKINNMSLVNLYYDNKGQLFKTTFGEGRTSSGSSSENLYQYFPDGKLKGQAFQSSAVNANLSMSYNYNPAGQMSSKSISNDLYKFSGTINVDRRYQSNGLNQYNDAGLVTFGYDNSGNLISDGRNTFLYDGESRLIKSTGLKTTYFVYDPLGRIYETSGSSQAVVRFLYDGSKLVGEYDINANPINRYAHGVGDDEPFFWFKGTGSVSATTQAWRFLRTNHQGSVIGIVDSEGSAAGYNAYDENGIPSNSGLDANGMLMYNNTGIFQFSGQVWLSSVGMYYYKARFYSPTMGRFLQTDPAGNADQINLYSYVGNDPINRIDPSGERTIYVGGGCDGYCTKNTTIVSTYAREHGGVFFTHFQDTKIISEMEDAQRKGEPIILIGHSWGASKVMRIIANANTPRPDLLVTIDPVGKATNLYREEVEGLWVNVTATRDDPNLSSGNYVADLWGKTDRATSDRADVTVNSDRVHEDFAGMLEDANIPQMINAIEKPVAKKEICTSGSGGC